MQSMFVKLKLLRLHDLELWRARVLIWMGAVMTGCVVVGFAQFSEAMGRVFRLGFNLAWWLPVLITPLGGMLVVWVARRWFAGSEGSGIPQTIAALHRVNHAEHVTPWVSLRIAVGKIGLGAAAVGLGFSTGREGPSVQVGASVMNTCYDFLPRGHHIKRSHLILAGGAAGIAAAFNTPLAGVVFAIEEMSRQFEQATNGVLLTAIVLAGMVSISLQGNYLYFGHIAVGSVNQSLIFPVLVCAVVCGIAGGGFSKVLLWSSQRGGGRFGVWRQKHPLLFAGLCGLGVALLGLLTQGAVHGSGYVASRTLLAGTGDVHWGFAPAKMLATLLSYLSGVPGGIFAPSLAVGAGIGRDLAPLFGADVTTATVYALCMAAFLAAVTQAPLTSCIIVMEMVDGHELVLSLIAVSLLASLSAKILSPALYHTLARRLLNE